MQNLLEVNKIYLGDCLELMKEIPTSSIDAIISDPPFTMTGSSSNGRGAIADDQFFDYWWRAVCVELARILKPSAEGFIWCDWKTAHVISNGFKPKMQEYTFKVSQLIYHYREHIGMGQPFRSSVDMIAYIRGPESEAKRISSSTPNFISSFWQYGKHQHHPAEKDVDICKKLCEWCSDPNDIIIDPFAGSGTSCIASKLMGRQYIGIEKEEIFQKIAENRLYNTTSTNDFLNIGSKQKCITLYD
jgi:site-specific DNA-methyltransferase (adenine-specific)